MTDSSTKKSAPSPDEDRVRIAGNSVAITAALKKAAEHAKRMREAWRTPEPPR